MSLRRTALSAVLLAFVGSSAAPAYAEGAASGYALQACALAYENSQEHRRAGALSVARVELARCAADDCPEFIRNDCAQWSKEAAAEQPSVLFAAKRAGNELSEVRVSIAGRVLTERLPSQATELDPGSYEVEFETPGSAAVVEHVVVRAGEKNQLVQVELAPDLAHSPKSTGLPATSATRQANVTSPSPGPGVLPWALLGFGAAGIGAGVGFALWGHSNEHQLRVSCAPNCTDAEVQPVRTKYLLGDVSLGVGLVSVSVAAYLLLSQRGSERGAQAELPVSVVAGPSGVLTTYGARF